MRPRDPAPFCFGAVILAAGASSRMGRPKMLLPWGTTTVIGHLVTQWKEAGATQIAVVVAVNDDVLNAELARIGFAREQCIVNPEPMRGMFSSIQCAARWQNWSPELTHWAIALGDQPHLASGTLRSVVEFAAQRSDKVCQPSWNGRPRHPVFFPRRVFEAIANSKHQTLKELLRARISEVELIALNDRGLDVDLDTPEDYNRARNVQ